METITLTSKENVVDGSTRSNFTSILPAPLELDPSKKWYISLDTITMTRHMNRDNFITDIHPRTLTFWYGIKRRGKPLHMKFVFNVKLEKLYNIKSPQEAADSLMSLKGVVVYCPQRCGILNDYSTRHPDGSITTGKICEMENGERKIKVKDFLQAYVSEHSLIQFTINQSNPFIQHNRLNVAKVQSPKSKDRMYDFAWSIDPTLCTEPRTRYDTYKLDNASEYTYMYFDASSELTPFDVDTASIKKLTRVPCKITSLLDLAYVKCNITAPSVSLGAPVLYILPLSYLLETQMNDDLFLEVIHPRWLELNTCVGGSYSMINVTICAPNGTPLDLSPIGSHTSLQINLCGLRI